jgi:hypothetical protein
MTELRDFTTHYKAHKVVIKESPMTRSAAQNRDDRVCRDLLASPAPGPALGRAFHFPCPTAL